MIFSAKALKNSKKTARYYTMDGFDVGVGKNVAFGKKLKRARGLAVCASHPSVAFSKIAAVNDTLYAFGENNVLYYVDSSGGLAQTYGGTFTGAPVFCRVFDGDNYATLISDGTNTFLQNTDSGSLTLSNSVPPFKCACYAYERLWTYKNGKLSFSTPLNYADFTVGKNGGGEILIPDEKGDVLALISYENRVYIFREKGIQRLDVRGEQTDFEISDCVVFSENIIKDSIAVGSECVYFATETSIYKLAVTSVKRVYGEYFTDNALSAISGTYADGCYYLLANGGDGISLNVFKDGEVEKINANLTGVTAVCEDGAFTAYVAMENVIYTLNGSVAQAAHWESGLLDLGQGAREKVLERVKIAGSGEFALTVESGLRSRKFAVTFKNGVADVPVAMSGDYFRFTLETESADGEIDELSCLYTLSKGGKL